MVSLKKLIEEYVGIRIYDKKKKKKEFNHMLQKMDAIYRKNFSQVKKPTILANSADAKIIELKYDDYNRHSLKKFYYELTIEGTTENGLGFKYWNSSKYKEDMIDELNYLKNSLKGTVDYFCEEIEEYEEDEESEDN